MKGGGKTTFKKPRLMGVNPKDFMGYLYNRKLLLGQMVHLRFSLVFLTQLFETFYDTFSETLFRYINQC